MSAPFPHNPLPGDDEYEYEYDDDFNPYEDEYPVD